jgi:molybdenum cofactor synthesis domain-containing protein
MQSTNALLPGSGFDPEKLIAPRQAIVAFLSRVALTPPGIERIALEDAAGRVLACDVDADDDYPSVPRSAMDGFAVPAVATPGRFRIAGEVRMGAAASEPIEAGVALRIPTGGALPRGADAVVPIEEAIVTGESVEIGTQVSAGTNVVEPGDDMRRGERILKRGGRIGSPQIGVLAALGAAEVQVYRRPRIAVLSSGDELVGVSERPRPGEVRDSNRYAVAASLRAMGASVQHYPPLSDESSDFTRGLTAALRACDAVVTTGGTSVGERDRLPAVVASLGEPGIVVWGLRLRPGKPTMLAAIGTTPIVGLPGNPTSALMVLEAVASPIVAALCGAPVAASTIQARLAEPARSRAGWTWYLPVALEDEAGSPVAHPLPLRSFSVSLTARAGGYLVMDERDECWPAGATVTVHRFLAP